MHNRLIGIPAAVLAAVLLVPLPADAQVGKRLKEKAKEAAARKAVEEVISSSPGADAEGGAADADPAVVADALAWTNFDFQPGERIVFAEDFSRDRVGNFPQRLRFEEGTHEIVEWNGRRWIRSTSFGSYHIPLPETLPDRFTMEFEWAGPAGWETELHFTDRGGRGESHIALTPHRGGLAGAVDSRSAPSGEHKAHRVFDVRVQVDGDYVKVYMDEKRVANAPSAPLVRSDRIRFYTRADERSPVYVANIRVAAGGNPLYDALVADGRVATQGIYFDVGSDRIRPESATTLAEIATVLLDHPELRLRIEGHTDDTGSADANRALSERRADAVKAFLVDVHEVDAARLETAGLGPDQPIAPNDSPEGRQQNRRVELVRL